MKFESHNDVSLPSRNLLQTHAALAKILHASGMGEHIYKVMEERGAVREKTTSERRYYLCYSYSSPVWETSKELEAGKQRYPAHDHGYVCPVGEKTFVLE